MRVDLVWFVDDGVSEGWWLDLDLVKLSMVLDKLSLPLLPLI